MQVATLPLLRSASRTTCTHGTGNNGAVGNRSKEAEVYLPLKIFFRERGPTTFRPPSLNKATSLPRRAPCFFYIFLLFVLQVFPLS